MGNMLEQNTVASTHLSKVKFSSRHCGLSWFFQSLSGMVFSSLYLISCYVELYV